MSKRYLSVLKNVGDNCVTYYVGDNPKHVEHLKDLKNVQLICKLGFDPQLGVNVQLLRVEDPQLDFYLLSKDYKEDYLENKKLRFKERYKSYIHSEAKIGENVKIGPGCVIGKVTIEDNVEIHANVTIYSKTIIRKGAIIESNSAIGSTGVMWVWNQKNKAPFNMEKVYLEQLGNVEIGEDCRIGSLVEIVRGSANETTKIGHGACIAHGSLIGHGCYIGPHSHLANGIKMGGSSSLAAYNFLGCGVTIAPGVNLQNEDIIVGAGATMTKSTKKAGVYVGTPAKWIKESRGKLSGMPAWRRK